MARPELLSIVIPCYRSAKYIDKTVAELCTELEGWCPFEIVLVNDGSPDDLQPVLERLARSNPRVRFIELGANAGQHFATLRGFGASRGDCVVTVDDDGQNPPACVKLVAELAIDRDLDVVYGTFRQTEQSAFRKLVSRLNRWMTKYTLGNTRGLALTNVRAIRGEVARLVSTATNSTPYIDALLWRSTRRIDAVEVDQRERADGVSTYSFFKLLTLWASHMTLLTILPLQFAGAASFVVALFAFIIGFAQMLRVLADDRAPPGWLSLFLAVTFLFSLLFMFLAIVSTYVGRIYVELNARGLAWVRSSSDAKRESVEPSVK